MVFEIDKQKLNKLYDKARAMYRECIKNKDNGFLKEEIAIPLEQIELKNASVKVIFAEDVTQRYQW